MDLRVNDKVMFAPEDKLREHYSDIEFDDKTTDYWIDKFRPFFGKVLVIIDTFPLIASHGDEHIQDIVWEELILISRGD